jgi:hypothetical protein
MSKSAGTTRTVSETAPSTLQKPYFENMLSEAQRLYQQPGPNLYPSTTVVPFNTNEIMAQEQLAGPQAFKAGEMSDWAQAALAYGLNEARNPASNPYFESAVTGATRPIFEQLTRDVLPGLRRTAVGGGTLGGTRQAIAEGLATQGATRQAFDVGSQMGTKAYDTGMNAFLQALGLAPSIQGMTTAMPGMISAAGAQQRALEQAQLNEEVARYTYGQNLPYAKLAEYANMISGPLGGTSATATEAPGISSAESALGWGMTILPLIQMLAGLFK